MKTETQGQRGKQAEKLVELVLKGWNNRSGFSYFRLPDSRMARGMIAASPGDYVYFSESHAGVIEVKSTENPKRIPKAAVSQLPILNKLEMAGASSVIVVLHKSLDKWRIVLPTQLEMGLPSWDLSAFSLFDSAEEALLSSGYFK